MRFKALQVACLSAALTLAQSVSWAGSKEDQCYESCSQFNVELCEAFLHGKNWTAQYGRCVFNQEKKCDAKCYKDVYRAGSDAAQNKKRRPKKMVPDCWYSGHFCN